MNGPLVADCVCRRAKFAGDDLGIRLRLALWLLEESVFKKTAFVQPRVDDWCWPFSILEVLDFSSAFPSLLWITRSSRKPRLEIPNKFGGTLGIVWQRGARGLPSTA